MWRGQNHLREPIGQYFENQRTRKIHLFQENNKRSRNVFQPQQRELAKIKNCRRNQHPVNKKQQKISKNQQIEIKIKLLDRIAEQMREKQNYFGSMSLYQSVLHLKETLYGEFSLQYVKTIVDIADVFLKKQEIEKALKYYEQCLSKMCSFYLGKIFPRIQRQKILKLKAVVYEKIGEIWRSRESHNIAIHCFNRSYQIRKLIYGRDHYLTLIVQSKLERCQRFQRLNALYIRVENIERRIWEGLALNEGESTEADSEPNSSANL